MFRDVELRQGRKPPRGAQAVVLPQGAEAEVSIAELMA